MSEQIKSNVIKEFLETDPLVIEVWLTRADQSSLFQKQREAPLFVNTIRHIPEMNIPVPPFAKGGLGGIGFLPPLQFGLSIPPAPLLQRGVNILGNRLNDAPTLQVDAAQSFQTMEGFGFTLTGGSALLISRLPALTRNALLLQLFSTEENGIGVSFLRLSIGASDLSERSFSYDDMPEGQVDPDLAHFNIEAGDREVIPLLKEILAINPAIKLIGSPWSAPPWMKTNRNFIGGKLKPEYFHAYANYLVKYINAMNEKGVSIHALTMQNEPLNEDNEPSMLMEAWEQADFVKNHLGPALREAGLDRVELFCWDHNCDVKEYPLAIFADAGVRQFLAGAAWHLYAGDIRAVSEVSKAYPDMKMYFTEQWVGGGDNAVELTQFAANLSWHIRNIIIGATRNGCQAVLEWNLASDPHYDPHTPGGCVNCVGALTIGNDMTTIPNVSYYVIAHIAKFVRPGSIRIFSDDLDALPNVAFATPNGTIVMIVLNENTDVQTFNIQFGGKLATVVLEGGSVATYVWQVG